MSKKHVLIVDDNEDIRNLIQATLGTSFYHFGFADNGQDAIDYLQEAGNPDLMILDMAMPIMDGLEVLEIVKSNPATRDIVVLILSAQTNEQIKADAMNIGAHAVITKPFGPLDLLQLVDAIFD